MKRESILLGPVGAEGIKNILMFDENRNYNNTDIKPTYYH